MRTETYCMECDNVVRDESTFCPECGAEDPWDKRPMYEFDEDDLPTVISYESYNDTYKLWNNFCKQHFGNYELKGDDVAGLPEQFPSLKYCVFEVYFVVTKSYEMEGPFLTRKEAREAGE